MADPPLVLVVDDEQSYRDALTVALQREGFAVETAADGIEALERFDAVQPALVLLDVMLPRVSGVDVCRQFFETGHPLFQAIHPRCKRLRGHPVAPVRAR